MELKIDPQDVNKIVAEAVLNSTIGDAIKAAVQKAVTELQTSYDNPLESVIRSHIADITREVLNKEHGDAIRERVKEALAAKLSNEFIDRVCEVAASRYN